MYFIFETNLIHVSGGWDHRIELFHGLFKKSHKNMIIVGQLEASNLGEALERHVAEHRDDQEFAN